MKKRLLTAAMAVVILMTGVLLTACDDEHTHQFLTGWRRNSTHHWHACQDDSCDAVTEYALHTWDNGTLTREATKKKEGEMTYTCEICGYQRREPVAYYAVTTADEATWIAAFNSFSNCEVRSTQSFYQLSEGQRLPVSSRQNERIEEYFIAENGFARYRKDKDQIYLNENGMKVKYEINRTEENSAWKIEFLSELPDIGYAGSIIPLMQNGELYSRFTYDAELEMYVANGISYFVPNDNSYLELSRVWVGFENGAVTSFIFAVEFEDQGYLFEQEVTLEICNYGKTVVEAPKLS